MTTRHGRPPPPVAEVSVGGTTSDWKRLITAAVFAGNRILPLDLLGAFAPDFRDESLREHTRSCDGFLARGVDEIAGLTICHPIDMNRKAKSRGVVDAFMLLDGTCQVHAQGGHAGRQHVERHGLP